MPPGKRKAAASSAADGAAPAAGQREERERGFDAKAVKDFLAKIQRPDRLGPNFFTDDERQQWQDYFDHRFALKSCLRDTVRALQLYIYDMTVQPIRGSGTVAAARWRAHALPISLSTRVLGFSPPSQFRQRWFQVWWLHVAPNGAQSTVCGFSSVE